MNVAYINPFLLAVQQVIATMVHVPIRLGRPHVRMPQDPPNRQFRVSATIGLGGAVTGLVVLSLPESVALALASGLSSTSQKALSQDCLDALAEIVNMIAGCAKKDLPGGQVTLTIPTLLFTPDVVYPSAHPIIVIPFDTGMGRFIIEVVLVVASDSDAAVHS